MDWAALVPHSLDFNGPPTLFWMWYTVYSKAALYAVAFVVIWALILAIFKVAGCGSTLLGIRTGTWALKSAMLVHHSTIAPLTLVAMYEDSAIVGMYTCIGCSRMATLMNRNPAVLPLSVRALTPVTLGYFMADLLLLSQWNLSKSGAVENGLMLMHHIASLIVWPAAVYFDWVARYVLIMLSFEFTSLWLTVLWVLSSAGLKKSLAYKLSGLIFTLSFVLMRMVGAVPQLVAMWNEPPWSVKLEHEAQPGGIHWLCWLFSSSLVLPHLLNLFWGVKVVQGFAAVMCGGKKKGGDKADSKKHSTMSDAKKD